MSAFLGVAFLFLSIFLIPEIRAKRKYWITILIACVFLCYLGFDKVNRDNKKDSINNMKRVEDSMAIKNISNSYSNDSTRFSDFKNKLETDFHIKDSANTPVKQVIINNIDRVNYLKQF